MAFAYKNELSKAFAAVLNKPEPPVTVEKVEPPKERKRDVKADEKRERIKENINKHINKEDKTIVSK